MSKTLAFFTSAFCCPLLISGAANAEQISQLNQGSWTTDAVCYSNGDIGIDSHAWVDMQVASLGYSKTVSMVWTDNNWDTSHEAEAWYESDLGNGLEQWGVDIESIGSLSERYYGIFWQRDYDVPSGSFLTGCADGACDEITVEYALRYEDHASSQVFWDNNGGKNYQLYLNNEEGLAALESGELCTIE